MECKYCQKKLSRYQAKYCSNKCQADSQYTSYVHDWHAGTVTGNRGTQAIGLSRHITRYLREKYGNECSVCGWSEVNATTGSVPLEVDHVDGNADNNGESNLRLLCPNCHSLTSNYRNLNIGHGRFWRREKYVKIRKMPL